MSTAFTEHSSFRGLLEKVSCLIYVKHLSCFLHQKLVIVERLTYPVHLCQIYIGRDLQHLRIYQADLLPGGHCLAFLRALVVIHQRIKSFRVVLICRGLYFRLNFILRLSCLLGTRKVIARGDFLVFRRLAYRLLNLIVTGVYSGRLNQIKNTNTYLWHLICVTSNLPL